MGDSYTESMESRLIILKKTKLEILYYQNFYAESHEEDVFLHVAKPDDIDENSVWEGTNKQMTKVIKKSSKKLKKKILNSMIKLEEETKKS